MDGTPTTNSINAIISFIMMILFILFTALKKDLMLIIGLIINIIFLILYFIQISLHVYPFNNTTMFGLLFIIANIYASAMYFAIQNKEEEKESFVKIGITNITLSFTILILFIIKFNKRI